jgi:hypothetical protein
MEISVAYAHRNGSSRQFVPQFGELPRERDIHVSLIARDVCTDPANGLSPRHVVRTGSSR